MELVTLERLKEVLHYNPDTGVFTWRKTFSHAVEGEVAGYDAGRGYWIIQIDNRRYRAHRLAWLYMMGAWPRELVDHKNLDRSDNRFENLREASHQQNRVNSRAHRNSRWGIKGVHFRARDRVWVAKITVNGRSKYLGQFDTAEAANAAYQDAAVRFHGEYARAK